MGHMWPMVFPPLFYKLSQKCFKCLFWQYSNNICVPVGLFFIGSASRTASDFGSDTKTFAIPFFVPDVLCLPCFSLLITPQLICHLSSVVVYSRFRFSGLFLTKERWVLALPQQHRITIVTSCLNQVPETTTISLYIKQIRLTQQKKCMKVYLSILSLIMWLDFFVWLFNRDL